MAEIIDFTSKLEKKIEVELENDGQRLLEWGIVTLWDLAGGIDLLEEVDHATYHMLFLGFADVCFENMNEGNIIVTEDGDVGVDNTFKEVLFNGVDNIKAELAANDNRTH